MVPERPDSIAADLVENLDWVQRLALSLTRNRDVADDLTQDAARLWLERRPETAGHPRGPRAWLAAVTRTLAVDRSRSELARRARERSVARPESEDLHDVVDRFAWQQRVTEAVMDLPEPYRSTILLRYLDQLPTRDVARRAGVGEATVRKRLERGLALLRKRLRGLDSRAILPGILLMTTKAKLACAAVAVGLALLLAIRLLPAGADGAMPVESGTLDAAAPAADASSEDTRPADAPSTPESLAAEAERQPLAPPAAPATGSLLLRVIWADDRAPAPGVLISMYRDGADRLFDEPSATSDEKGLVRFADVRPGRVHAIVERGSMDWGESIGIAAGKETERTVEVPSGMDCRGVVVDAKERPVAGAEILVAGWAGGLAHPLARSGPDGRFALRAIGTHTHVGARAPGYAASPLRQFTAGEGAEVELTIVLAEEEARLDGIVLDPRGDPVAGAVVQAGRESLHMRITPDGAIEKAPMPARARTDAEGRFAFASLPAGSLALAVRARGLSPWAETLEVSAGASTAVTVRLASGVTLLGTVRDDSGDEVPRATVSVGAWDDLGSRRVQSDASGGFRIEGLAAGELEVDAERDGKGTARTVLRAAAGETVRWDAVLSTGLVLRGLVLDAEGEPAKQVMIEATLERGPGGGSWSGFENTGADGRFEIEDCPAGRALRISARRKSGFPETTLRRVLPEDGEVVVRMPEEAWIHIQGTVLDPDGKILPNVHVSPSMRGGTNSPAETVDPATGSFRCGPYPPGEYQLYLQADGYPVIHLPWRTIGPDEVWDVGTLRLQRGGSILVNVVDASASPRPCWVTILDAGGGHVKNADVESGVARAGPFAPGAYLVQVTGEAVACRTEAVEVRAGVESRVDVHVRDGILFEIDLELPEGVAADEGVVVAITGESGEPVMHATAWSPDGPPRLSARLAPGSYAAEATLGALRGSARFAVSADQDPARTSIRLSGP